MPCFDALSAFSTQAPSYNGFVQEKEEHTPEHGYLTQIETSRYVGAYGTDVPDIVRSNFALHRLRLSGTRKKSSLPRTTSQKGGNRFI